METRRKTVGDIRRLLFVLAPCLLVPLSPCPASAQDAPHKLRWLGQSFFQWELPGGKKIVFDPHLIPEFGRSTVTADLILISHRHNDHDVLDAVENHRAARVFHGLKEPAKGRTDWNKIDEKVGGVRIRSVATYHDADNGLRRGKNAVFVVEAEGLTVCHLGDLGHELSAEQVKAIGPVDVLIIPVGGVYTINGEAARAVVNAIKPKRFTVPMHYGVPGYDDLLPATEFLEGLANVKRLPSNELVVPTKGGDGVPPAVVLLRGPGK